MAALKVAVVIMGMLIVAGFAVLVGVLVTRVGGGGAAAPVAATLDEPAGTRIASISASADRLAVSAAGRRPGPGGGDGPAQRARGGPGDAGALSRLMPHGDAPRRRASRRVPFV